MCVLGCYYCNNVVGIFNLFQSIVEMCKVLLVFLFIVVVYGMIDVVLIFEDVVMQLESVYGEMKWMFEQMIYVFYVVYGLFYIVLCYFNVCGVVFGGDIGEVYFNKMYFIEFVCLIVFGQCEKMMIFGDDYFIFDGICICDYVYVQDFVDVYVLVVEVLYVGKIDVVIYNVGLGYGFFVCEVFDVVDVVVGIFLQCEFVLCCVGDLFWLVVDVLCIVD